MCYSGACRYERRDGTCMGRAAAHGCRIKPACFTQEDWDAYLDDADHDAILDCELRQEEASIPY